MSYNKELIAHKLLRWEHYLNNYRLPAWKELPDIGLYMDQVIALLSQYLDFIPVEDMKHEKPVAPTTINNYVRLKVMPAPEKRKYYRIHIAFLIMIFTLKQGASISGLQQLLPANDASEEEVRTYPGRRRSGPSTPGTSSSYGPCACCTSTRSGAWPRRSWTPTGEATPPRPW